MIMLGYVHVFTRVVYIALHVLLPIVVYGNNELGDVAENSNLNPPSRHQQHGHRCDQPWCDPSVPESKRIQSLISQLSLEEKITQLQTTHSGERMPGEGNTTNTGYIARLGIEAYTTAECLHGVCRDNVTVFPQSITLAASWDEELLVSVAQSIGNELRGLRNGEVQREGLVNFSHPPQALTCFSPQINIVRDPRWGRAQETYGESPFLTAALAQAYVSGLQGNHSKYLRAVATPKHFNAYGGATSRGHRSPTEVTISWRDWVETFLPAFRQVLSANPNTGASALSTMCSYNTLCVVDYYNESCPPPSHGVPACANKELLTSILRDLWKFDGYVISDAGAIKFIETDHEWASSQPEAAADALLAGADMALGGGCSVDNKPPGCISFGALGNATSMGLVQPSDVDVALARVLRARFRLGQLDPPDLNPYSKISESVVDSWQHRQLAIRAAQEGIVLLKNEQGLLPFLSPSMSLAVIGPNANVTAFGNYNGNNNNVSTVWSALKHEVPSAVYAHGCDIASTNTSGFASAIEAASHASITIAVMGIDQSQEHETGTRTAIELPGVQIELLESIKGNTSTKLIVVLMGGSAMAVPWIKANADAVLWVGYGGEEAGTALADVLFGRVAPAGRLPITFYESSDQLPSFESYDMSLGRTFRYLSVEPLWYFGQGMGYSTFSYSAITTNTSRTVKPCDTIVLDVTVTHASSAKLSADEVVEVYVALRGTRSRAPRLALAGFKRIHSVVPGGSATVQFVIAPSSMAVVVAENRAGWFLQPASITVWIGGRQPTLTEVNSGVIISADSTIQQTSFDLLGPETPLTHCAT
eukprot:m.86075 g.86075  ORF g.86075 m.86075 type:complete len:819 (+) comp25925_c0_seq2:50-2506(+)